MVQAEALHSLNVIMDFTDKANSAGFIAVYPEGVRSTGILGLRTWNAGSCRCDFACKSKGLTM